MWRVSGASEPWLLLVSSLPSIKVKAWLSLRTRGPVGSPQPRCVRYFSICVVWSSSSNPFELQIPLSGLLWRSIKIMHIIFPINSSYHYYCYDIVSLLKCELQRPSYSWWSAWCEGQNRPLKIYVRRYTWRQGQECLRESEASLDYIESSRLVRATE